MPEDLPLNRQPHEISSTDCAEHAFEMREVPVNGALRDAEPKRDFLIRVPVMDERQNFELTVGEPGVIGGHPPVKCSLSAE